MLAKLSSSAMRLAARRCAPSCSYASSSAAVPQQKAELPVMPAHDWTPPKYEGPSKDEVYAARKEFLNPAMFHFYKEPLMITHGNMQYLYDETGRRYLDAFAGIVTVAVGHSHPKVVKAACDQIKDLQHTTTIYLGEQISMYAKELVAKMPADSNLSKVYFVNSGSEANDMAMLMARLHTGNHDIMALRNGYHGMSNATMAATAMHTWKYNVPGAGAAHHAMSPCAYRGRFGSDPAAYAQDLSDVIASSTSGQIAGFWAESVQGIGGCYPLLDGYLPLAYDIVRKHGGVCVADEVQTGFGRLGTHYWGFEEAGVTPDIVTMAKGIGNGFPLAAVVTTPEIAQTMAGRLHFNTYGGNPVVSAVGRAVLEAIEEDGLQENARVVGAHLKHRLLELKDKHDIIGDVRGKGLMVGCELVRDRETKEPASEECKHVMNRMREMGVLVGSGGLWGNTFRIKPPMCFSMDDADFTVDVMDHCLSEL